MSLKKVNDICIAIAGLDDEEINAAIKEAELQYNYAHPLKTKTASKHQSNGAHNLRILTEIKELKNIIEGHEQ